jgi:hypothetical protein
MIEALRLQARLQVVAVVAVKAQVVHAVKVLQAVGIQLPPWPLLSLQLVGES